MPLFPLLRSGDIATPLPPSSLEWISRLFADEPVANQQLLARTVVDSPWMAAFAVVCEPRWRDVMPASLDELVEWCVVELPQLLCEQLDVGGVADEQLDRWAETQQRYEWLQRQCGEETEQVKRLALFSAGPAWYCGPDGEMLDDEMPDDEMLAGEMPAGEMPAGETQGVDVSAPTWLRRIADDLNESPAQPAKDGLGRLRQMIARRKSYDGEAPPLPSRFAPFRRRPNEESLEFVRVVERMGRRSQRIQQLESDFASAVETEKLEALKELAYGASHEINNPLANIATRAQTLIRDEPDEQRRRSLATINAQAFRAHEMISDIMLFARPPRLETQSLDLRGLLGQVRDEILGEAEAQSTTLTIVETDAVFAEVDPNHLAAAVRALLRNSLEALVEGGRVEVDVTADDARESVAIAVCDNGPGIPEAIRPRIFDAYFSGREAGRGLGLGLSKAWTIARQHGGELTVEEAPGGGVVMRMVLPQRLPAAKTAAHDSRRNARA